MLIALNCWTYCSVWTEMPSNPYIQIFARLHNLHYRTQSWNKMKKIMVLPPYIKLWTQLREFHFLLSNEAIQTFNGRRYWAVGPCSSDQRFQFPVLLMQRQFGNYLLGTRESCGWSVPTYLQNFICQCLTLTKNGLLIIAHVSTPNWILVSIRCSDIGTKSVYSRSTLALSLAWRMAPKETALPELLML